MKGSARRRRGGGSAKEKKEHAVDEDAVPIAYAEEARPKPSPRQPQPAPQPSPRQPEPEPEPEPSARAQPATAAASLAVVALNPSSRPGGVPLGSEWFLRNGRGKMRSAAAQAHVSQVNGFFCGRPQRKLFDQGKNVAWA